MLKRIWGSLFILGAFLILILFPLGRTVIGQTKIHISPRPVAPVKPVTTDYYGTKVVDPYRYMENLKDPKVQAWMKAQNDYTRAVLARIPGRQKLLARIRQLDESIPQVRVTRLPGDRYLILKTLPGETTARLYLRRGLSGKDTLLVDPAIIKLAPADQAKGRNVITSFTLSPNGKYIAVGITPGGALFDTEIHVIETSSGRDIGEVILHAFNLRGPPNWLPGSHSFVYDKVQKEEVRAYLHVLGRNPNDDPAVFGVGVTPAIRVDPRYIAVVGIQPGSGYTIAEITTGVSPNGAFYIEPVADLGKINSAWRKVSNLSDDIGTTPSITSGNLTTGVAVHGDDLYLLSYKDAPRSKVIRTSARKPDLETAETFVPPGQAVVTEIHAARDALYVELMDGGINRLLRVPYGPKPKAEEVALPFKGAVELKTDPKVPGALLGMNSSARAYRIYAYIPRKGRVMDTELQPNGPFDNPSNITSAEVKARSYDGTKVPLSIVYPKGMKLDGSHPTLLIGYGAYGTSMTPTPGWLPMRLTWAAQGGVEAICHVRGGGEYGEPWHLAGKGPTKPNTWKDFIACAQYLIRHKYTSPARLAGMGVSAGGITIGRAIEARPDLFAAAIDWAGLSDMLRYETTPNGETNTAEFGSVKTKAGFKALYAMSPYAHVKAGTHYPAVLLMTGMNDWAVTPWEIAKMTARLQAATSSGKPILLRVDYSGGHSTMGGTRAQLRESWSDMLSFLLWQLGAPGFQPKIQN